MLSNIERRGETGIEYFARMLKELDEEYHLSEAELNLVCLIISEAVGAQLSGRESDLETRMPEWQRAFNSAN